MKQGMGSAVNKFKSDVPAHISQHGVVTHPQCVLAVVAVGIPRIDGSHGAGIRSDERRKRKYTMAILAAAGCKGRGHGMTQSRGKSRSEERRVGKECRSR